MLTLKGGDYIALPSLTLQETSLSAEDSGKLRDTSSFKALI